MLHKRHEPLTNEQRDLALKYLPLARSLAKPLKSIFYHWKDEFESAACMALVEAAKSFDPKRNIKFATFARFRIRGALSDVGREIGNNNCEDKYGVKLVFTTINRYTEKHAHVRVLNAQEPVEKSFDDVDAVERNLRHLPAKNREVCSLMYLYGKTQSEIAKQLNCSQAEISRVHLQSLTFLRHHYKIDGPIKKRRRRSHASPQA